MVNFARHSSSQVGVAFILKSAPKQPSNRSFIHSVFLYSCIHKFFSLLHKQQASAKTRARSALQELPSFHKYLSHH